MLATQKMEWEHWSELGIEIRYCLCVESNSFLPTSVLVLPRITGTYRASPTISSQISTQLIHKNLANTVCLSSFSYSLALFSSRLYTTNTAENPNLEDVNRCVLSIDNDDCSLYALYSRRHPYILKTSLLQGCKRQNT